MKILIKSLEQMSKNRPGGYLEDCLSHGIVAGNFLEITSEGYSKLLEKYRPQTPYTGSMRGAGDMVYKLANPIAHVIDAVTGTHIQGCGGCAKRRESWNKAIPFK